MGFMGGMLTVPLRTSYQLAMPAEARGHGMALMNAATMFATLTPGLLLSEMTWLGLPAPAAHFWLLAVAAAAGAIVAWRVLLRETIEQLGEIILWVMYRIRARGPGRFEIPLSGPLLIIANHTAWFDPLWLAKVLPRRLTPMMTSKFFDLPILHWLMRNVAGAIRLAHDLGPGHTIVTVLCDSGTRYQSKLWNPEFLRTKGLPVPEWLA